MIGLEVVIERNLEREKEVFVCINWELILFLLLILMCSRSFLLFLSAYLNFGCSSTRKDYLKSSSMLWMTGFLSLYFLTSCCLNIWLSLSFILLDILCFLMS